MIRSMMQNLQRERPIMDPGEQLIVQNVVGSDDADTTTEQQTAEQQAAVRMVLAIATTHSHDHYH